MNGIEIRQALAKRQRVYGILLQGYGQPGWPHIFRDCGLDYVFMDSEHTPLNRETIAWAAQAYAANNIAPWVRIPEISESAAAQVVDAGAQGVIVPYVETLEQCQLLIGAVKYRPLKGIILQRAVEDEQTLNQETKAYLEAFNAHVSLIIMIESPEGAANLQAMLATGQVDGVIIGPHDLSVSCGVPEQYSHPTFLKTTQKIIDTCAALGVGVGIHVSNNSIESLEQWVKRGCNIILHQSDTRYIAEQTQQQLGQLRERLKD